jgi:hypothetical protein
VSHNLISQGINLVTSNVPKTIEDFDLSNNLIKGALSAPSDVLVNMKRLLIGSNMLWGLLTDISAAFPN